MPVASREQEKALFKSPKSSSHEITPFVLPPEPTFRPARISITWLFGIFFMISSVIRISDPGEDPKPLKVQDDHLIPAGRSMLLRDRTF